MSQSVGGFEVRHDVVVFVDPSECFRKITVIRDRDAHLVLGVPRLLRRTDHLGFGFESFIDRPVFVTANVQGLTKVLVFFVFIRFLCYDGIGSVVQRFHHSKFLVQRVIGLELKVLISVGRFSVNRH